MRKETLFNFLMFTMIACFFTGCVPGIDLFGPEAISAINLLFNFSYLFLVFSVTAIGLLVISEITKKQLTKMMALYTVLSGFIIGNILFAALLYAMLNGSFSLMALESMLTSIPILGIVLVVSIVFVFVPNDIVKILKNIK